MSPVPEYVLVSLNVAPKLEEVVIDWLLARADGVGFTSYPVNGHSSSPAKLTAAEQVSGRRRRVRFEIAMPGPEVAGFLDAAAAEFGTADVRYLLLPAVGVGSLKDVRPG